MLFENDKSDEGDEFVRFVATVGRRDDNHEGYIRLLRRKTFLL
jgi:hypothetical protein